MGTSEVEQEIREKYGLLKPMLDERARRRWAAAEAKALGYGGPTLVSRATGLSRSTVYEGLHEIERDPGQVGSKPRSIRAKGGGRKRLTAHDPNLVSRG